MQVLAIAVTASLENIKSLQDGSKHMFVWGWAEYDDVFEGTRRHRTEFCNEIVAVGDLNDYLKTSFNFPIYSRHNGADADCMKSAQT